MKTQVEIKILGREYSFKTDTDIEHINRITEYIKEKEREIESSSKEVSTLNKAILLALNIADDYLKNREEHKVLIDKIEEKSKKIIDKIEFNIYKDK